MKKCWELIKWFIIIINNWINIKLVLSGQTSKHDNKRTNNKITKYKNRKIIKIKMKFIEYNIITLLYIIAYDIIIM